MGTINEQGWEQEFSDLGMKKAKVAIHEFDKTRNYKSTADSSPNTHSEDPADGQE